VSQVTEVDTSTRPKQTSHLTGQKEIIVHTWPVQDAKARFSEFLEACLAEGPQLVTKRGAEAAVLVPVQEWRRLQQAARPSLKQLLLADQARVTLVLPARGQAKRRTPQAL
jgi:prevent-host-death family protein